MAIDVYLHIDGIKGSRLMTVTRTGSNANRSVGRWSNRVRPLLPPAAAIRPNAASIAT